MILFFARNIFFHFLYFILFDLIFFFCVKIQFKLIKMQYWQVTYEQNTPTHTEHKFNFLVRCCMPQTEAALNMKVYHRTHLQPTIHMCGTIMFV